MARKINRNALYRLLITLGNMAFVIIGLNIINYGMASSVEVTEDQEIPREAALPFRQMTKEERAKQFFEDLNIDISRLTMRDIQQSLGPWEPYIREYSSQYNVDPDLVGAIVYAESKGDPFRISKEGALGLMQIMPQTADFLGFDNVLDPEENIRAGVMYIAWLLGRYGETHALWAWNAGPTRVDMKLMPGETRKFILEVLTVKRFLKETRKNSSLS